MHVCVVADFVSERPAAHHVLQGRLGEVEAVQVVLGEHAQSQVRVDADVALRHRKLALQQVEQRRLVVELG